MKNFWVIEHFNNTRWHRVFREKHFILTVVGPTCSMELVPYWTLGKISDNHVIEYMRTIIFYSHDYKYHFYGLEFYLGVSNILLFILIGHHLIGHLLDKKCSLTCLVLFMFLFFLLLLWVRTSFINISVVFAAMACALQAQTGSSVQFFAHLVKEELYSLSKLLLLLL